MSDEALTEKTVKWKKDKVLIGLIVCALIVAIIGLQVNSKNQKNAAERKLKEEYLATLQLTELSILSSVISSVGLCEIYSDTWRTAIDRRRDFSTAVNSKISENQDNIDELENSKETIDELMKKLKNPSQEFTKAYEKMLEIYGIYTQLYSQARSPSGSLMTFNQNINKLQEEFLRANNELGIIVPDLKDK